MEAKTIYDKLRKDFIKDSISDYDWAKRMPDLSQYLYADFIRGGMGLMCDFVREVNKVYTTVFLSDKVLGYILRADITDALIFSHHPTAWGIKERG